MQLIVSATRRYMERKENSSGCHEEWRAAISSADQSFDKRKALVAVDMGAESCRVSLLRWKGQNPDVRLVHRFPNGPVHRDSGLKWDLEKILKGIEGGLRACAEAASEGIAAIGVDCWAVDYVRLGNDGKPLGMPFCYRDERNRKSEELVHHLISRERLYQLTGIQSLQFNTLYQLYADKSQGIPPNSSWLNMPEYVLHWLGAGKVAEYTNATHSEMVTLGFRTWCKEIFDAAGLEISAAPRIVPPGTIVGKIQQSPLADLPAFRNALLIAPACHDTASAIAGIPASGDDWAFISSGTWSLVGTVLDSPCATSEARERNYTNLGGVGGKFCFLKNVNGMWLINQCIEHWSRQGEPWGISGLVAACEHLPVPESLLDLHDPDLWSPGEMPARINAQRGRRGQTPLSEQAQDAPMMANLIFHSLAALYGNALRDISTITGKKLKRVFIVGGGSKNAHLNRLTAAASGLEVVRGPVESSIVGNLAIQCAILQGAYTCDRGVESSAVARWAGIIADAIERETSAVAAG
jgi:rhamnulokinase